MLETMLQALARFKKGRQEESTSLAKQVVCGIHQKLQTKALKYNHDSLIPDWI